MSSESSDKQSSTGIVLVVDDNPTNLAVLVNLFRESGFKTLVATDGESAIAQIQFAKPDIILLDVMMPGIDGFETCKRLKADPVTQEIPIIFMTALSETVDKVRGFNIGAVDYITKPFDREEVLVRLKTHLTIQNLNRSLRKEISDRKRAEESLRVFLHAVSHDLRNPVTGTLLVLQDLLEDSQNTIGVPRSILERMAESNNRQLGLIDSLLESHVNDVRGLALQMQPSQLGKIAQDAIDDLESLLVRDNAKVRNLIPVDLPLVTVDPVQIDRVFLNLISNALKHNPPGLEITIDAKVERGRKRGQANESGEEDGIAPPPDLATELSPATILCTVTDNGKGLTPEQCEHLFELYTRGTQSRQSLGLGLGLYLCRQIVTAHGGEIGVTSSPKDGSQFWFTLPVA